MLRRLRTPDYLVGLSGAVLLASLFAPWYDLADGTSDGWRSLAVIDWCLLITALLALAVPLLTAIKDAPTVPIALDVITTVVSLIATILVLFRVLSTADPGGVPADGRAWGLWLALLSAIGVFASAWWATRLEDAPGLKPPPELRHMPTPPVQDPTKPPT